MKVTELALRKSLTVFALMVIIVLMGTTSYIRLPRESGRGREGVRLAAGALATGAARARDGCPATAAPRQVPPKRLVGGAPRQVPPKRLVGGAQSP